MNRLLTYSLERGRRIRVIWQAEDGALQQATAQVTALTPDTVTLSCIRPKREVTVPLGCLLSADYRKGDEGQVDA